MGRVIYLDCFSGIAGDMLLGALVDAGLPVPALKGSLGSLGIEYDIEVARVTRAGIGAVHFSVKDRQGGSGGSGGSRGSGGSGASHGHPHEPGRAHGPEDHRTLDEINALIQRSALSDSGKARAIGLFRRLGEAEAAIHQIPLEQVHLHEVGALDSIIDIVGAVFAMEWFGVEDVVASPLNVGSGTVRISHGTYPVPAPATLRLIAGVPVYSGAPATELVTPTGALLVTEYARAFGAMPPMIVERTGYGAGTKDFPGLPNVLRVVLGERTARGARMEDSGVVEIVCEIDDMNPQLFAPVSDKLMHAGAIDVYLTPIQMKKGRPGTLLTALAAESKRSAVTELIFRETTTIGVRFHSVERETLERRWQEVTVPGGTVRIKIAGRGGQVLNAAPEFDDCVRVAEATGQPLKAVQAEAMKAWLALKSN